MDQTYQVPRAIETGRVWVNCFDCLTARHSNHGTRQCTDQLILCLPRALSDHAYPAHTLFGGYKQSGFGRENHKMALNDYRQVRRRRHPARPSSQAQPVFHKWDPTTGIGILVCA